MKILSRLYEVHQHTIHEERLLLRSLISSYRRIIQKGFLYPTRIIPILHSLFVNEAKEKCPWPPKAPPEAPRLLKQSDLQM